MKTLMKPEERAFSKVIMRLVSCNHFLPIRLELEREALGSAFVEGPSAAWNLNFDSKVASPNILRLSEKTAQVVESIHQRLRQGARLTRAEMDAYENLVYYHLYHRYRTHYESLTLSYGVSGGTVKCFDTFSHEARKYLQLARGVAPSPQEIAQLFAGLWQMERAFIKVFCNIVGSSLPIARLRAAVWESIFTCNLRRYRQGLFQRMHEITTLITGPSGTGKELVASAIAGSGYIPFSPDTQRFVVDHRDLLFALNLSALSSNLIESELFGHRRGAFTGALQDQAGWLEVCPAGGSVFLDEIGEVDSALQIKLLRVLQTRTFHRLGESRSRSFHGKLLAATNRDLGAEIEAGRFREDFYYRLCSDRITTPSLREQLSDSPGDLPRLVHFIARGLVGMDQAEELTQEVIELVERQLGCDYSWPGNFRELEQCVRNILVRRCYEPIRKKFSNNPAAVLVAQIETGQITAEELLQRYCSMVYARTQNIEETARRLNLDRRTVKTRLERAAAIR